MYALLIPFLAATNDVASVTTSSTFPFIGFSWAGTGVVAAVIAVVAVAVRKSVKAQPSAEKLDKDELLNDVLAVIAKDEPNRDALRAELAAAIAGTAKPTFPALVSVLRVEESYEKLPSNKYRRRVSILRSKEESPSGTLSKVESEVSWEYIPDAVRGEFIRTRQDKIARLVYVAEKEES